MSIVRKIWFWLLGLLRNWALLAIISAYVAEKVVQYLCSERAEIAPVVHESMLLLGFTFSDKVAAAPAWIAGAVGLTGIVGIIASSQSARVTDNLRGALQEATGEVNLFRNAQEEMFYAHAALLFLDLKLENTDRVSLYIHRDKGFLLLGRYSTNTRFDVRGRAFYQQDKGFIGKGWANGEVEEFFEQDSHRGAELNPSYLRWHGVVDMDEAIVSGLTMHSRAYIGLRLDAGLRHVGFVMVESTEPKRLELSDLRNVLSPHRVDNIIRLVELYTPLIRSEENEDG